MNIRYFFRLKWKRSLDIVELSFILFTWLELSCPLYIVAVDIAIHGSLTEKLENACKKEAIGVTDIMFEMYWKFIWKYLPLCNSRNFRPFGNSRITFVIFTFKSFENYFTQWGIITNSAMFFHGHGTLFSQRNSYRMFGELNIQIKIIFFFLKVIII